MSQDDVFFQGEGDSWFRRNRDALQSDARVDWPIQLIGMMAGKSEIRSVIELGCSNGYRLASLKGILPSDCRFVGTDASLEAVRAGKERYPWIEFHRALLSEIPVEEAFDLVIVHFVLHWVDRRTLGRSVSEIDRVTLDGGVLVLGDFLPDYPQRRRYHHLPGGGVYTWKQDYARIFEALGTYREFARIAFDHSGTGVSVLQATPSSDRGYCALLKKSLETYYPEV